MGRVSVVPFAFAIVSLRPVERDDGEGERDGPLPIDPAPWKSLVSSGPSTVSLLSSRSGCLFCCGFRAASVMLGFILLTGDSRERFKSLSCLISFGESAITRHDDSRGKRVASNSYRRSAELRVDLTLDVAR